MHPLEEALQGRMFCIDRPCQNQMAHATGGEAFFCEAFVPPTCVLLADQALWQGRPGLMAAHTQAAFA